MGNIHSKHRNQKAYYLIIKYDDKTALEWCCQCPAGNRTVGMCSHLAGVLWYLALARHEPKYMNDTSSSYMDYFKDAEDGPKLYDSGDSEDED
ncbi:unnamed protein product, partial [Didymodactylos carnosus]